MWRALNMVYVLVISLELGLLGWIYSIRPPGPSEPLSVGLGWAGLGSMILMLVYVLARRSRNLRRIARLSVWLNLHIFLGMQGVLFIIFHSSHIFTRNTPTYWSNPAVINFFAVLIVFGSGIFGRFLYANLPKMANGDRLALADAQAELGQLTDTINSSSASSEPNELQNKLSQLKHRQAELNRRLSTWRIVEPIFRWWIILHRPLAAIMYILSIVHVILTYMFTPSLARP